MTPQKALGLLEKEYGPPAPRPRLDPLSELILGILSQNTSDKNSHPAFEHLRATFPRWDEAADAPEAEIAEAIRPGGLHRVKARHIQRLLRQLKDGGGLSLDFLASLPAEEALKWLQGLPGVGPKTARVVLLFAFGRPVFPVDTHIHRVTRRLGWLNSRVSREAAHQGLEGLIEPQDYYPLHLVLITHGRRTCLARQPRCPRCPLAPACRYFQQGGRLSIDGEFQRGEAPLGNIAPPSPLRERGRVPSGRGEGDKQSQGGKL